MPLGRPFSQGNPMSSQDWLPELTEISGIRDDTGRFRDIASSDLSQQVSYGLPHDHVMLLSDNGTIYSWGYGSLATCSSIGSSYQFSAENAPKEMKITDRASFSLSQDGSIQAWGDNTQGLLGIGEGHTDSVLVTNEVTIPGIEIENLDQLVLSGDKKRAYAIDSGTLYAWGDNTRGILGVGDNMDTIVWTPHAVNMPENDASVRMVVSNEHGQTFALTENSVLYGWGNNEDNTLGLGE